MSENVVRTQRWRCHRNNKFCLCAVASPARAVPSRLIEATNKVKGGNNFLSGPGQPSRAIQPVIALSITVTDTHKDLWVDSFDSLTIYDNLTRLNIHG
ncbi:hypothetical protein Pmani_033404 [Petrolisthes manimaculis]|uniref:Uncharacterized protein n=1 Tax=Petrolisthes manimaculis TaxID=1843537 RepID=A0AAE1NPI3_9EUCA|nr:hypothetical protein Pmani_033404 [Petrolisthes manimaculis]